MKVEVKMAAIGGIVSIVFTVWFYLTAESKKAPAIQWAIAGFISYFVPYLVWIKLVAAKKLPYPSAGILVGGICAWLVLTLILKKLKQPE
ncbi:MAG: hypothetical protein PHE55_00680 [Methylococcaceae bacterium]|nr:hypothetical protein [Methylococcaceae bacterium]